MTRNLKREKRHFLGGCQGDLQVPEEGRRGSGQDEGAREAVRLEEGPAVGGDEPRVQDDARRRGHGEGPERDREGRTGKKEAKDEDLGGAHDGYTQVNRGRAGVRWTGLAARPSSRAGVGVFFFLPLGRWTCILGSHEGSQAREVRYMVVLGVQEGSGDAAVLSQLASISRLQCSVILEKRSNAAFVAVPACLRDLNARDTIKIDFGATD